MKFLLTGFSLFSDIKVNPSQVIVDDSMNTGRLALPNCEVTCAILPTEYVAAETQIVKLIDTVGPTVIICLGVDPTSTELRLERVALNSDDAPVADNAGDIRCSRMIVPDGPSAYFSTFPWKEIRKDLASIGLPVRISDCAGTYVCNHLYYQALHYIAVNKLNVVCGFMHMPLLPDVYSGIVAKGHLKREDVLRALERIVGIVYQHLSAS